MNEEKLELNKDASPLAPLRRHRNIVPPLSRYIAVNNKASILPSMQKYVTVM